MPTEETYSGDWEDQLLRNFVNQRNEVDEAVADEDKDKTPRDAESHETSNLSYADVMEMISKLQQFAIDKDSRYLSAVQDMKNITEAEIVKQRSAAKQTTIDSFFK